jgi:hypothetical protein
MSDEHIPVAFVSDDDLVLKKIEHGVARKFSELNIEISRFGVSTGTRLGDFFVENKKKNFKLVIVDFSNQSKFRMDFVRVIRKYSFFKTIPIFGIHADNAEDEEIHRALHYGCTISYIKKDDVSDLIDFTHYYLTQDQSAQEEFAKAIPRDIFFWPKVLCRVFNIDHTQIDILSNSSAFETNKEWMSSFIPSGDQIAITQNEKLKREKWLENLSTLQFSTTLPEEMQFTNLDVMVSEYEQQLYPFDSVCIANGKELGDEQKIKAMAKSHRDPRTRVLLIDRDLSFIDDIDEKSYDLDYNLFVFPYFKFEKNEIDSIKPDIILIQLDDSVGAREDREENNSIDDLKKFIDILNERSGQKPFVFITNTQSKSDAYKKIFDYEEIITFNKPMSSKLLVQVVNIFKTKQGATRNLLPITPGRGAYSNISSRALLEAPILVHEITEQTIKFSYPGELSLKAVLRFEKPCEFYVSLTEQSKDGSSIVYHGIVHGISETEKMKLRKFVNNLIFMPKKIERVKEKLEFKKKNLDYLLKKQEEQEKKDQEEKKDEED